MDSPYISIVIVGRNDNYGVNFLERLKSFVNGLDVQVTDRNLIELVIVEWNPPEDAKSLIDSIDRPENYVVRVITVPGEVHARHGYRGNLAEYQAKNVGIARARGKFVLVTNPDIVFSRSLIDLLAKKNLDEKVFYRADRYDFIGDGMSLVHPKDYEQFAARHSFQGHMSDNSAKLVRSVDGQKMFPISDPMNVHTNASGDFILASKDAFFKIGGMFFHRDFRSHCDSITIYRLLNGGFGQSLIQGPCVFHQEHERAPIDPFDFNQGMALSKEKPEEDWGMLSYSFKESFIDETRIL